VTGVFFESSAFKISSVETVDWLKADERIGINTPVPVKTTMGDSFFFTVVLNMFVTIINLLIY
jgi:hypothetical protein